MSDGVTKPSVLQVGPYPDWDQVLLEEVFAMHRYFDAPDKASFLADVGPNVRGIATRGDLGADRVMIEACPNLDVVSVYGVGFDPVDLSACKERGIRVTNTPDVLTNDVADMGVAMMLAQTRGALGAEQWVRNGNWVSRDSYPLTSRVWGTRAGILGLGRIGHELAKRLAGFDMDIAYCDVAAKDFAPDWTFIVDPVTVARHVDVLFECTGAQVALAGAIPATRPGGTIMQLGLGGDMTLPVQAMTAKELSLKGSVRFHEEFHIGVSLMQKRLIDVKPYITHTFALANAVEAFQTAGERSQAMKAQISFDQDAA